MACVKRASACQYEPLITPQSWQGEEQRFSIRLTQLLDDLHRTQGQLSSRLKAMEAKASEPEEPRLTLLDIYPVGSLYLSVNAASPQQLFGGTWEQITDTFLLAAGSTYQAGSTGGEASHTLTVNEMPSHKHSPVYFASSTKRVGLSGGKEGEGYSYWKLSYTNTSGYLGSSFTTEAAGGDTAHNNMPPYLTVYVWKRTA